MRGDFPQFELEASILERDHAFAPSLRGFIEDELPHGQAIEEFVRNYDRGPRRHILDAVMPANRARRACKRGLLRGPQRRRRLNEVNGSALQEGGKHAQRAQRIRLPARRYRSPR